MDLTASKDEATGRWNIPELEPSEKTFERICEMLRNDQQFKFARYGDGEFFCMFGKEGHNCDKHEYFLNLGGELRFAFFSDPKYMIGIQPLSVHNGLYKKAHGFGLMPRSIYNADALHNASIDGNIQELFHAMSGRPILVVGPDHLSKIGDIWIKIHPVNCWLDYDRVYGELYNLLNHFDPIKIATRKPVVLLCASMMSEVLIHDFKHHPATFIDCGSVFDPYYGKLSRSYHHKLKL